MMQLKIRAEMYPSFCGYVDALSETFINLLAI